MRKNEVIHGSFTDHLDDMLAFDPDLIIADPPYNVPMDFGDGYRTVTIKEWVDWVMDWLLYTRKHMNDNCIIYLYGYSEYNARISAQLSMESHRWLIWSYTNKNHPGATWWQRSHECILSIWKPHKKRPKLNIDDIREPYTRSSLLRGSGKPRPKYSPSRFKHFTRENEPYKIHPNGALPRDVLKVPALVGGTGFHERPFMCRTCDRQLFHYSEVAEHRFHDKFRHPTQKPRKLTERLIRSKIRPSQGGKLFVPFVGSGSECVTAQKLGVDFLGTEINDEYVEFARKWLAIEENVTRELL